MKNLLPVITAICLLSSCSVNKPILKQAKYLLNDSAVNTGHIGISIYEPATGKYWYNYNADHYFIPASNTKLFSLYAGMKYLGDSLTGAFYSTDDMYFSGKTNQLRIIGNADPTFLHPDFKTHPLYDFLKSNTSKEITLCEIQPPYGTASQFKPLGRGWAWDDYNSSYMAERSFFPLYGNVVKFKLVDGSVQTSPSFFSSRTYQIDKNITSFHIERFKETNAFFVYGDSSKNTAAEVTMKMGYDEPIISVEDSLLSDTLKQKVTFAKTQLLSLKNFKRLHSQPSDSLFKPMMHRSDNFFAEQTLLMASNEFLGYMSDEKMIDTILRSSLKDVPQKPKWVDGSGLSRYNLFTPQSFVYILHKMKEEFGMERMKLLLPTGGEGTLSAYYKKESGFIYAKTGTLSNNCALSGYLITKKGKLLIFSILNNNYITGATPVRRAVERFLQGIREKN
jgi:serine-type D-Ala-D-Ala carboxypeptidase/endopeptidase (penicillin-binding protein 4)